ncbi:SPW repeat protein [Microvirga thermotolerans]|nr:SPW repeat protein [Microvirga thermotolerans]
MSLRFEKGRLAMIGLKHRSELTATNILNSILAVFLFFSPWLVGFRDVQAATWNAGVCGLAIGLMAALAITELQEWEEWVNAALGLWTAAAPWALGFAGVTTAMWTHVLVGLAAAVLAAVGLWLIHASATRAS